MIRLITVCDLHLSAHSPAAWKVDYELTLDGVLAQIFNHATRIQADAILVAGDFFHLKAASRNPLGFLTRTVRRFWDAPCPVYGIAGNHDLRSGSIWNGGLDGQPLDVLQLAGAVKLLDADPVFLTNPEHAKVGCWIQGASFEHGSADTFTGLARQDDKHPHVHLGHFGFSPGGSGQLFGERVYGPEDLGAAFDVAVIGHHHWDQGVTVRPATEFGTKWYVAHGSPCWTSCHKADRDRRPAIGLIEIESNKGISAEVIHLELPPFEDLIDAEKRDLIEQETEQLEEFTEQLGERLLEAPDPERVLDDLELEADVRERARAYLEGAESE